jgi:hypothetical protein
MDDHQTLTAPPRLELRRFGIAAGVIIAAGPGLLLPWLAELPFVAWPFALGGVFVGVAALVPAWLGPVWLGWMRVARVLNRIVTPLLAAALYFLVVTPVALIARRTRSDSLRRGFDATTPSYRIPSRRTSPADLERPY